ncbi:hypothetical protein ACA910_000336 [Epithemia clementina (nom. ined.)]
MVSQTIATAALLSTGFISLAPNLLLLVFSVEKAKPSSLKVFLNLGQALASGALLGDVFLHALPHHGGKGDETGIWILTGFALFLITDILTRTINRGEHDHKHSDSVGKDHVAPSSHKETSAVALSMIADALHNFTDGLAIGASFTSESSSDIMKQSISSLLTSRGGLATISIMLHEIPHEIGDFCTLLQAGFSKRQAILAQFVTAVAAFAGTLVALFISDMFSGDQLSLITAGGFVYLASVTILPEVLGETKSLSYGLAQLAAFLSGIAFMRLVAFLEEHDGHHHSHGHHDHLDYAFDSGHHHNHHQHRHNHQHGDNSFHEDSHHHGNGGYHNGEIEHTEL